MNWFLNNREVIKDLKLNTGTSQTAVWTVLCCVSEMTLNTEFNTTDFYTFCDAIQRSLITGASLSIETTVKLDINNAAVQELLGKIHSLLTAGSVAQFNNETIRFDLLEGISSNVLTYATYEVPCNLVFESLGGSAEDEGEFALTINITGKATTPSS